ncbi:MAG TPA: AMP-binding protein [Conexibacter sp.]|nr:AMP-binding protein [Conexibacter sp.]
MTGTSPFAFVLGYRPVPGPADRILHHARVVRTLVDAGLIAPTRPDRLALAGRSLLRWGTASAGAVAVAAARAPHQPALIDELGTLSYGELHRRANALASSLAAHGIRPGDGVAIMCRNHRGFMDATVACSRLGAHALYLNTMFAAPQLADVVAREGASAIVYDEEFAALLGEVRGIDKRFVAWRDGESDAGEAGGDPLLEDLIAAGDSAGVPPAEEPGRVVILTSGTTGTPKGARRSSAGLSSAAALLSKIPYRAREVTMIAAPLFHSWGLANYTLGVPLASTFVLRRRFDPEGTLRAIARHRATALVVVPVMLQRILELPQETLDRYDTSSLRVIAVSGSALPGPLATRVMDQFGDVLYNLYGSTEVAWATIATPDDLRAAPGCAGRPPLGTVVKLFDEHDREVAPGQTGRIFVASGFPFEGYTGGDTKATIGELMSSGDVGHFDAAGRLFIDGRDDDMIVSGGENVFPAEVEDLLAGHECVREVAVVGVADEAWGQRLKAVVVLQEGERATADELKDYVKRNLGAFKVPREIAFVEALPRNATGKVLKRDLV